MNTRSKKSGGWALILVLLGLLALYGGPRGLVLLVPAAILVWYAVAEPAPRDGIDARATIEQTKPAVQVDSYRSEKLSRNP